MLLALISYKATNFSLSKYTKFVFNANGLSVPLYHPQRVVCCKIGNRFNKLLRKLRHFL